MSALLNRKIFVAAKMGGIELCHCNVHFALAKLAPIFGSCNSNVARELHSAARPQTLFNAAETRTVAVGTIQLCRRGGGRGGGGSVSCTGCVNHSKSCYATSQLQISHVMSVNGVCTDQLALGLCQYMQALDTVCQFIVQELCESRDGRPGLSVLTSLLVSVDVKRY